MIYFKMEKIGNSTYNREKKDKARKPCRYYYTSSRGRTGTMLPSLDFESSASANSAMLAYDYDNIIMHILSIFSEVQSR